MELNIGANIKKLRIAKGLTQEQLAELLNLSSASISKWEAKSTYPDITMLFPLANIFDVSVDELMGYDAEKEKGDIEKLLDEYRQLQMNGQYSKAQKMIAGARKSYPNNYHIMHAYMWDKAGGAANNNSDTLLKNQEEFMHICDCILEGCTEETLRLDALTMRAKLLHASGNTNEALKILEKFPTWFHSSAQKTEQLFSKDTPEFRYWIRKNTYGFLDVTANKIARTIWYDECLSAEEKTERIEAIGDSFSDLCMKKGMEFFVISAQMIYAELAGKLSLDGEICDIIRIREKQFAAMEGMMRLSETDEILKESIIRTYKTENVLKWQIDWLMNTTHTHLAKLRENAEYRNMLLRWKR